MVAVVQERLKDFPTKTVPTSADIIYVGDAAVSFTEVQSTIGQIFSGYSTMIPSLAGLSSAANTIPYFSDVDTFSLASFSSFGRDLIGSADPAAGRVVLQLETAALKSATDDAISVLASVDGSGAIVPGNVAVFSDVVGTIEDSGIIVSHNVYTPTLFNVGNLDASTAYQCQYMRIGNVVTVSGQVDINPTAAASTKLGISLPIASNFANPNECGGTAFALGIAGQGAAILADATNNRAQMQWIAVDVSNQPMYFSFTYLII